MARGLCLALVFILGGCSRPEFKGEANIIEIKAPAKEPVEKVFESKYDLNTFFTAVTQKLKAGGKIDPEDTRQVYFSEMQYYMGPSSISITSQNEVLNSYLKQCDKNGDGVITGDEVRAF
jgi:hypothetical protein